MTDRVRCIIVDDEILAREGLRSMAQRDSGLNVIAECSNGMEAVQMISTKKPDLVFLDIQMPEMDGFGVLKELKLGARGPRGPFSYIIFVTAYDQYAVRAFDVHALDYLLKPVDEERFKRSVSRAKEMLRSESEWTQKVGGLLQDLESKQSQYLERLIIKEDGRIFFIKTSEIDWIEAKGNYALIHSGRKSYLVREAMNSLENQLNPERFFRIHRSTIVNIERIHELQSLFHGDCRIILQDGTKLLMSRRFRDKIKNYLSI
jgi:two-component system, LytTR family, response regulator